MKLNYRNILALYLIALILFSTIGFNMITTYCFGCEEAHTSVAFTAGETEAFTCCGHNAGSPLACCSNTQTDHREQHPVSSKLIQLKLESPEVKSKLFFIQPLVLLAYIITPTFTSELFSFRISASLLPNLSALSGKALLTFICVFRN